VAVPGLLLGLATTGVVSATTGPTADDAASTSVVAVTPSAATGSRSSSVSRGLSEARPALPEAAAAEASRAEVTAAKQRVAKKKAAQARAAAAAKAETARQQAAALEAAEEKAARQRATQARLLATALRSLDTRYTRVNLNVRAAADQDARLLTVLETRSKLSTTSVLRDGWRYVSYQGKGAWVKDQYLVEKRPAAPKKEKTATAGTSGRTSSAGGTSSAACAGGSAVEAGLTPDAVRVHRALCARFPSVTAYGGVRADADSYHSSGRALDAMISGSRGWEVARWVRANASQLGVSEVIFSKRIWTVQRGSEGWRSMSDRGSVSANHFDHVHVSVYGSSGG